MSLFLKAREHLKLVMNSPVLRRRQSTLHEVLLLLGKEAFPTHGHAVILAGGAGSGKGFVIENILGIEGVQIDPDYLKQLSLRADALVASIEEETGKNIKDFDLRNPNETEELHGILKHATGVMKGWKAKFLAGILSAAPERKPNIILDTTLSSSSRFRKEVQALKNVGYARERIHLVWVINSVEMALKQNRERDRVVPEDILIETHTGAALTVKQLLDEQESLREKMDGKIAFVFNRRGIDSEVVKSEHGGSYIKKARIVTVKEPGEAMNEKVLTDELRAEIRAIVPAGREGW